MRTVAAEVSIEMTYEGIVDEPCSLPISPSRDLPNRVSITLANGDGELLAERILPADGSISHPTDFGFESLYDAGGHTFCTFSVNFGRFPEQTAYVLTDYNTEDKVVYSLADARDFGYSLGFRKYWDNEAIDFYGD